MSDARHLEADVAIVGYGPVGQALAALLGRAGHRVVVFERFQEIYGLPRAVHLDHEIMRLLQSLGLADALAQEMIPVHDYQWFGADGELLLRFDMHGPARSGWHSDYMFFQPELEAALDRLGCAQPCVTVERGWAAERLRDTDTGVELTVRRVFEQEPGRLAPSGDTRTVRARWVVGADGANSFVREASGIARRDLGFQERWLVVDAEPHDMGALAHLPSPASGATRPARPRTCRAVRATGAGSSCCCRASSRRTSTTPGASGRCSSRGTGRRTDRSRAAPSTSSARCWPTRCARDTFCWSATPPT